MRTYAFYHKYILSFFLQATFCYSVVNLIPKLSKIKLFFSAFDHMRLTSFKEKIFFFFLLQSCDANLIWKSAASRGLKIPHYLFSVISKNLMWLERLVFFNYAYFATEAIKTLRFSNDTLTISLSGFRFFEQEFFRISDRFVENPLEFGLTSRFQLFVTPKRKANLYEQRSLLRGLNIPLRNYEKGLE